MSSTSKIRVVYRVAVGMVLLIAGCSQPLPPPSDPHPPEAWLELRRTRPELRSYRNDVLLDFETPTDRVFVTTAGAAATSLDTQTTHSGRGALRVTRAPTIDVKLSSVMSGRTLPGEWALLGAYIHSDRPTPLQVQYLVEGKPILTKTQQLAAGQWTPAMLDITDLPPTQISSQTVTLRFTSATPAELWIDDVMLIDNTESMVGDDPWRISQAGHTLTVEHEGRFRLDFPIDPARDGWSLVEAGRLRVIVAHDYPQAKRWVIYRSGARYMNGESDEPIGEDHTALAEQHRAPAAIEIPEDQGSLNRRSPGDANNDGYNETLGAYLVTATKPRIEIHITPRTAQLIQPAIQIRGLPAGKIVATLEGRLIEQTDRLDDGSVLVIPPHQIQRPVTLNVRVQ